MGAGNKFNAILKENVWGCVSLAQDGTANSNGRQNYRRVDNPLVYLAHTDEDEYPYPW